jgi:N-acetylmuramoyl-L-alanine amidase
MSRRAAAGVVVLIVFAGVIAGCGGGDNHQNEVLRTRPGAARQARLDKLHHLERELAVHQHRASHEKRSAHDTTNSASARTAPTSTTPGTGLAGQVIAIDPGHDGGNGAHPEIISRPVVAYADGATKACDTTGTETNDGVLTESLFNLEVADVLAEKLRALGATVVMIRTSDTGVGPCIDERAEIGNRAGADAAISIHADGSESAGAHGFDVIYPASDQLVHPSIAGPSTQLATHVRDALVHAGIPPANYVGSNGLDARDDLGGLNLSSVPKVFAELGNMRSASEAAELESAAYRAQLAEALAVGIESFLQGH